MGNSGMTLYIVFASDTDLVKRYDNVVRFNKWDNGDVVITSIVDGVLVNTFFDDVISVESN